MDFVSFYLYVYLLELLADSISLIAVFMGFYYIYRLLRLGKGVELLAIKGGRGPKYIALAVLSLAVNRVMDILSEPLFSIMRPEIVLVLDDPPAALAAILLALGLRNMYTLYRKTETPLPSH